MGYEHKSLKSPLRIAHQSKSQSARQSDCGSLRDVARPQLLVSVRDADEARAALAGGADIIDIKEPRQGPLGRAEVETIHAISQVTLEFRAAGGWLTAALGELPELPSRSDLTEIASLVDAVKIGLSQSAESNWEQRWRSLCEQISIPVIAVVYADWQTCGAPSPSAIIDAALQSASPGVLFDTFHKISRTLFDVLPPEQLREHLLQIQSEERFTALAGSLTAAQLETACQLHPDIIAVRSAVCLGGRTGQVDRDLVAQFRMEMQIHRGDAETRR